MAELDKFSGQITAEEVLFRSMLNAAQVATSIYTSTSTEWQRNALNYEQTINNLEALVSPFLGKVYRAKVLQLKRDALQELNDAKDRSTKQQLVRAGHDREVKLTIKVANEKLKLIQAALHDSGILFSRSYQIIGVDDEAPPETVIDAEPDAPTEDADTMTPDHILPDTDAVETEDDDEEV